MKIFFIQPFQSEFADIYEIVKFAASSLGYEVSRADDFENSGNIVENVNEAIENADIVVADVSDFTGNVASEFGTAQSLKKPIIPIGNKSEQIDINLSHFQAILYDRLRLQNTLSKPLINYLSKENNTEFLKKKTSTKKRKTNLKSIFVSYSHKDVEFLERLNVHLKPFEKGGQIDLWSDTKIKAGEKWQDKINKALDESVIAILLVSADFLASDFIVDNELPPLLKDAEEKGKVILPLIVKPCRFTKDENLSKFQSINDPKFPLSKLNDNDREEMYVKVADVIDNLVI